MEFAFERKRWIYCERTKTPENEQDGNTRTHTKVLIDTLVQWIHLSASGLMVEVSASSTQISL
jgi:hypothetical protein